MCEDQEQVRGVLPEAASRSRPQSARLSYSEALNVAQALLRQSLVNNHHTTSNANEFRCSKTVFLPLRAIEML